MTAQRSCAAPMWEPCAYDDGPCLRHGRGYAPSSCPDCGRPISHGVTGWWTHADGTPDDCWRMSMDGPDESEVAQEAYAMGVRAAEAAASWIVDGNSSRETIERLLAMIEEGDPAFEEYVLGGRPTLGVFQDDPTPLSLAQEITGEDDPDSETIDALAEAWETGVAESFYAACERELRASLPDGEGS